jgi:sulfonate transport system permease protein
MPSAVIEAALKMLRSGELFEHISVSAGRALAGLAIGGGLAFIVGLLTGIFTPVEKTLDSTLQMIRTVPNLALTPLVILWFGIGDTARVFLISLGVFFPIYLNTFHGVRYVDRGLVEMGRTYGLSRWGLFRQIILPGALPSVLVGLRYSLGIMWLTLIVAETIAASSGIGFMTQSAREFMQTDVMFFAVILYALLGKLADVIARSLESRLLQWHPNYRKA